MGKKFTGFLDGAPEVKAPSLPVCETCDDTGLVDMGDPENGMQAPVLCPSCTVGCDTRHAGNDLDEQSRIVATIHVRFLLSPAEAKALGNAGQSEIDCEVRAAYHLIQETLETHLDKVLNVELATLPGVDVQRL